MAADSVVRCARRRRAARQILDEAGGREGPRTTWCAGWRGRPTRRSSRSRSRTTSSLCTSSAPRRQEVDLQQVPAGVVGDVRLLAQQQPNRLVFGLAEEDEVGQLRSNKPMTLYAADSYVVSCCSNLEGTAVLSGHLDQRIYRFFFDDASRGSPHWEPAATVRAVRAGVGRGGVRGGQRPDGHVLRQGGDVALDYSRDESEKVVCAAFNPRDRRRRLNRFRTFQLGQGWRRSGRRAGEAHREPVHDHRARVECDGSRLTVGSLCGAVDLFDACLRRVRYRASSSSRTSRCRQ